MSASAVVLKPTVMKDKPKRSVGTIRYYKCADDAFHVYLELMVMKFVTYDSKMKL